MLLKIRLTILIVWLPLFLPSLKDKEHNKRIPGHLFPQVLEKTAQPWTTVFKGKITQQTGAAPERFHRETSGRNFHLLTVVQLCMSPKYYKPHPASRFLLLLQLKCVLTSCMCVHMWTQRAHFTSLRKELRMLWKEVTPTWWRSQAKEALELELAFSSEALPL